jgi:carbonic anhydrase
VAVSPASFCAFTDVDENVRAQMLKLRSHPWVPREIPVRGFVYDVRTGKLTEVPAAKVARHTA